MAVRRSSSPLDERSLFAEYPFLAGAESLLGGETVSVRGLLSDAAYARARSIGRARVLAAADDPRARRDVEELSGADPDVRYLSFLFSQILLAAAPSPAALRRWAVAESKRTHGRLSTVPVDELVEVAGRLGFSMEDAGRDRVALSLLDYLRLAVPVREADFRLARQEVDHGRVVVDRVRAARVLQEAVRLRLGVPVPLAEDVRGLVREREAELFEALAQRMPLPVARATGSPSSILPGRFPPCIRKMQRTLQAGENLSHAGRFALAAFLHRIGADFETIVDAYRGAPDFDESVTRYQVEHITHHDHGTGYEPPECDTLRSHGLCVWDGDPTAPLPGDRLSDPLCHERRLRHPLQYYRIKGGAVVERAEEGDRPGASPPGAARDTSGSRGTPRSTGPR
jgi:DNA primase large subunit